MVARRMLEGIDGRAPTGVEPAAQFDSTREFTRFRQSKDSQIDSCGGAIYFVNSDLGLLNSVKYDSYLIAS